MFCRSVRQTFPGGAAGLVTLTTPFQAEILQIVFYLSGRSRNSYAVTLEIYACFAELPPFTTMTTTPIGKQNIDDRLPIFASGDDETGERIGLMRSGENKRVT